MLATAQVQFHTPVMAARVPPSTVVIHKPMATYASPQHTSVWAPLHKVPPSPDASSTGSTASVQSPRGKDSEVGRGRLDLLALAMEQAAAMQQ